MTIEERLANLEKGYKQLCQAHDKNQQIYLGMKTVVDGILDNINDYSDLIKDQTKLLHGQQLINDQLMKLHQDTCQRLQKLEEN